MIEIQFHEKKLPQLVKRARIWQWQHTLLSGNHFAILLPCQFLPNIFAYNTKNNFRNFGQKLKKFELFLLILPGPLASRAQL